MRLRLLEAEFRLTSYNKLSPKSRMCLSHTIVVHVNPGRMQFNKASGSGYSQWWRGELIKRQSSSAYQSEQPCTLSLSHNYYELYSSFINISDNCQCGWTNFNLQFTSWHASVAWLYPHSSIVERSRQCAIESRNIKPNRSTHFVENKLLNRLDG